jgi:hypothetical protein
MKNITLIVLPILFLLVAQSVSAQRIDARIDSEDFPSGSHHLGDTQDDANIWIQNTGDVGHQFWISYSVMDRSGQWYTAPPVPVWADPSDSDTLFANPRWQIPYDALLGGYQAEFALYGDYDRHTGQLYNLLDQVDKPNAFWVVR